jgi:hypothetical protein
MKTLVIAVVVAGCAALGNAQSIAPSKPQASVPPPPPSSQDQAHPRRALAKLEGFDMAPSKATANQIGGASRGAGSKLVLYAPHKARVFSLRPTFSWKGDAGAQYKIHVQDVRGGFSWEREVTGTTLNYPADMQPLEPGETYLWRVEPVSPLLGPPPPAAMMVVVGGPEREQMEDELGKLPGTGFDAEQSKARYFFDHRLWYDAVMVASDLIARHPERTDLYEMRAMLYYQLPETEALADLDLAHSK